MRNISCVNRQMQIILTTLAARVWGYKLRNPSVLNAFLHRVPYFCYGWACSSQKTLPIVQILVGILFTYFLFNDGLNSSEYSVQRWMIKLLLLVLLK
jgi:hypothetical protein